jgi:hypothetical protein
MREMRTRGSPAAMPGASARRRRRDGAALRQVLPPGTPLRQTVRVERKRHANDAVIVVDADGAYARRVRR